MPMPIPADADKDATVTSQILGHVCRKIALRARLRLFCLIDQVTPKGAPYQSATHHRAAEEQRCQGSLEENSLRCGGR